MSLETRPNSLMPESIQGEYLDCMRRGDVNGFKALMKVFSEAPLDSTVQEGYVVLSQHSNLINVQDHFWRRLKEYTGIAPQADTVDLVYNALMQEYSGILIWMWSIFSKTPIPKPIATKACLKEIDIGSHIDFLRIYSRASETPALSVSEVNSLYSKLINVNLNSLSEVINGTGIPVETDIVLTGYAHYFEKKEFDHMGYLSNITGVEIPRPVIQDYFLRLLKAGSLADIERFSRNFSSKPTLEIILESYKEIAKERLGMKQLFKISEKFNVPVPREVIDTCYKTSVESHNPQDWVFIKEKTGLLPQLTDDEVQAAYSSFVIEFIIKEMLDTDEDCGEGEHPISFRPPMGGWEHEAKKYLDMVREFTGVNINPETIFKAYRTEIMKRHFLTLESLMNLTEIPPSREIIDEGYSFYFREKNLRDAYSLFRITNCRPSDSVVKAELERYLETGKMDNFNDVLEMGNLIPTEGIIEKAKKIFSERKEWSRLDHLIDLVERKKEKPPTN